MDIGSRSKSVEAEFRMHPSQRFQEFHMNQNIFPPLPSSSSSNQVGHFSRNNNFAMSDQPSHSPAAVIGSGFSRGSNDKLNGLYGNSVNDFASNQPEEFPNLRYPNRNGYTDQNNLVATWQPNEKDLHEASGNAVYTSLGQLHSGKVLAALPSFQGQVNQLKPYQASEITRKSRIEGQAQDFSRFGQSAHHNSNPNALGDIAKPSLQQTLLIENLQSRSSVGVYGEGCFQESSNIQEKNDAYRGSSSSIPSIDGKELPELHKCINDIFAQSQLQISSSSGGFLTNNAVKGDTELGKTFSSAASALIQPLKEENSAKKAETDLSIELKNKEKTSYIKAADNVASKASEKLWNGTLQLSSSVRLSTAAYFRSGDKMPDICWSDPVEVKGKVRLEAFEKFIQDLPRSRNRGLMVMSLCLIEGSTKEELKGMNEVIKKYKNGKRVGRANLSPGVDVYICPNSETIIAILSKNGFSKGLVAVEDYHDPLLGCVVWRKNASSDPGSSQLGNESISVQPSTSSPKSSEKTRTEAIQLAAAKTQAIEKSAGENKNTEPCDLHAINSIVKQLTEIEASIFQSLGIEKLQGNLQLLGTLLPSSSKIVKQPVPLTEDDDLPEYEIVKQPGLPNEDDDLPEYDFGDAVPHSSSSSNPLEAQKDELVGSSHMCVQVQKDVYSGPSQKRKADAVDLEATQFPVQERATKTLTQAMGSKTKGLFDEDDMPEWEPPVISQFRPSTGQTTRPPCVSNALRPPHTGVTAYLPPPLPPGPPPVRPSGRPQHRPPYDTVKPMNHSRWSRR